MTGAIRYLGAALLTASVVGISSGLAQDQQAALQISERDCRQLVRYFASQSPDYQPGVDVRGRPVKRADYKRRAQIEAPDTLIIPITVDFCSRVNATTGSFLCSRVEDTAVGPVERPRFTAESVVGIVEVRRGGREVYYEGEPLHDEDRLRLELACEGLLSQP